VVKQEDQESRAFAGRVSATHLEPE
jgi:hypothetical protein